MMKMNNATLAEDLPQHEQVYLKKDWLGWKVVHPITNKDGSINKTNLVFGGARNFVFLIVILIFLSFLIWAYLHDVKEMKGVVEEPCAYCHPDQMQKILNERMNLYGNINWTKPVDSALLNGTVVSNATG